jgi:ketosteroid isomerase-like protein
MYRITRLVALGALVGIVLWLHGLCLPALAKHRIARGADVQIDDKTVQEIHEAFHRVEHALEEGDIDALMDEYSEDYGWGSLKKEDMRKIWSQVFRRYRRISSQHSFSRSEMAPTLGKTRVAKLTCSGSLWATNKETGKRVTVDSWLGEVHYLIYENGKWKFRGRTKNSAKLEFGDALHPLF